MKHPLLKKIKHTKACRGKTKTSRFPLPTQTDDIFFV